MKYSLYNLLIVPIMMASYVCNAGTGYFATVAGTRNFADYHYVGTHNSHVYKRFFKTVYQHTPNITTQLNKGVRGFMLDTYTWNEAEMNPTAIKTNVKVGNGNVVMSHGKPGVTAFSQKGFTSLGIVEYQTFQYELEKIITFLKNHPSEIVIIVLENRAPSSEIVNDINAVTKRLNYNPIFKPSDWPGAKGTPQTWPTLQWMRDHNKRLMIVTNAGASSLVWPQWTYMYENQYATIDVNNKLCDQRAESIDRGTNARRLAIFSHFRGDLIVRAVWDMEPIHEYNRVKNVLETCRQRGFAQGKMPNGYFGDRIVDAVDALKAKGKKTVFDYMNELNRK